eukprot:3564997-Pyramimonas_sp.AAC.1
MGPAPPRTAALAMGWGWVELGQPGAPERDWIVRQWPLLMRYLISRGRPRDPSRLGSRRGDLAPQSPPRPVPTERGVQTGQGIRRHVPRRTAEEGPHLCPTPGPGRHGSGTTGTPPRCRAL